MAAPLIEVRDRWGRAIRLDAVVWTDHILDDHFELAEHLDAVRETLANPDIITFDNIRSDTECFYRYGAVSVAPRRPFKVVIRFIGPDDGTVLTAYIIRRIQKGETIKWQK